MVVYTGHIETRGATPLRQTRTGGTGALPTERSIIPGQSVDVRTTVGTRHIIHASMTVDARHIIHAPMTVSRATVDARMAGIPVRVSSGGIRATVISNTRSTVVIRISRAVPRVELVSGLLHPAHVAPLVVHRGAMLVGLHAETLCFSSLGSRLLLGGTRPVLVLTGDRVLAIHRHLALTGVLSEFRCLVELPAVRGPHCHGDESDHDDQRDDADDDHYDGIHNCLPFRGRIVPAT